MDAFDPPNRVVALFTVCARSGNANLQIGELKDAIHENRVPGPCRAPTTQHSSHSCGDCNPTKERRAGEEARRGKTQGASLLDSAPSDSSDDSGPVLAKPPSRLGGTAVGDFGGKSICTFRSGLRSSSEHRPSY